MWAGGLQRGLRYHGKNKNRQGKRRASCDLTVDNRGNLSIEKKIALVGLGAKITERPHDLILHIYPLYARSLSTISPRQRALHLGRKGHAPRVLGPHRTLTVCSLAGSGR